MAATWRPGSNFSWLYVADDGRIVGRVTRTMRSEQTYWAEESGAGQIGEFYTDSHAKQAVEKAHAAPAQATR